MIKNRKEKGFTLIEFLIYIGITVFLMTSITLSAINVLNAQAKMSSMERVSHSAEVTINIITHTVQNAQGVESISGDAISLTVSEIHKNPTQFYLDNGRIMIKRGDDDPGPITGERVEVTALSFDNPSPKMIEVTMTIEHVNPQGLISYEFEKTFRFKENIRFLPN